MEKNEQQEENLQKTDSEEGLFGIDMEDSLESVNFATKENLYLNEHYKSMDES